MGKELSPSLRQTLQCCSRTPRRLAPCQTHGFLFLVICVNIRSSWPINLLTCDSSSNSFHYTVPFWLFIHIILHLLALLDQHPRFARPQKTRATSYKMQINHGSKILSYICSVLMCTLRRYFQFKSCLQLNIDKHIQHKVVGIWLLWIHMGTKYIWARNDITMHIVSIYIIDQYCDS